LNSYNKCCALSQFQSLYADLNYILNFSFYSVLFNWSNTTIKSMRSNFKRFQTIFKNVMIAINFCFYYIVAARAFSDGSCTYVKSQRTLFRVNTLRSFQLNSTLHSSKYTSIQTIAFKQKKNVLLIKIKSIYSHGNI